MWRRRAIWLVLAAAACRSGEPETGRDLYLKACARCHGAEGQGGMPSKPGAPPPRDLTRPDWQDKVTDDQIREQIRHGKGEMPAFSDVLTVSKIDAVVEYVRSLRKESK